MSTQYSAETEAYTASVVAVGGEWPGRVAILRQNFPNNEAAFRGALEKYVYAAHQAQRQQAQQPPNTPGATAAGAAAASPATATPSTATGLSFPGAKSYPGQQAAPPPAVHSVQAPTVNASGIIQAQPLQPSSAGYIPYAREQRLIREPTQRGTGGEVTTPSTGSNNAYPTRRSLASTPTGSSNYLNNATTSNSSSNAINALTRSTQPRTSSSLNPAASSSATSTNTLRTPKLPPATPVYKSREPLPPYFPIAPGQAFMTTYPSRLRLGLTNLMQPVTGNGTVVSATSATAHSTSHSADLKDKEKKAKNSSKREKSEDAAVVVTASASNPASASGLGSRRTRTRVDYTEKVDIPSPDSSSDSEDEEDENEAAEEDTKLSRSQRALKRSGVPIAALATTGTARASPGPDPSSKKRKREKEEKAGEDILGGGGRTWLGQDPPAELVLVQPARRHFLPYVDEREVLKKAGEKSMYVPIRIDLDTETHRIRDTFTWNLNEIFITPELFTRIFCLDADLPFETYGSQILSSIQSQLDSSTGVAEISLLTPEQESVSHESDIRVILNLDIQIGTLHLVDRVEWDLTSQLTPEEFAKTLCGDLGLGGEAVMLVSHAVHEELLRLKREVLEMGLVGRDSYEASVGSGGTGTGAGAGGPGRGEKGPKKLESVWRDWNEAKMFGPHVEILSPEDIDALENEKERNPRRMRKGDPRWQTQTVNRERAGRRRPL